MSDGKSPIATIGQGTRHWQRRFVRTTALSILVASLLFIWLPPLFMGTYEGVPAIAIGILFCLLTYLLSRLGRDEGASRSLTYGLSLAAAGAYGTNVNAELAIACFPIATTLHLYLTSPEKCVPLIAFQIFLALAAGVCRGVLGLEPVATVASEAVAASALVAVQLAMVLTLGKRARQSHDRLLAYAGQVELVVAEAARVAQGDLAASVDQEGELADAFRDMVARLRELVRGIVEVSAQVAAASAEILATTEQQKRGAIEQSSAAAEIRETMKSLLESSRQIEFQSISVAKNAEQSLRNNEVVRERIDVLTTQLLGIEKILRVIKDIADKSEFLALNAALEGTRAGEAGRGFALVAAQMKRLAESIIGSLGEISRLAKDVREASATSVAATDRGITAARQMATSAQQISSISRQQRSGTEQASNAMEEISDVALASVEGTKQVVDATRSLAELVESLEALAGRFRFERDERDRSRRP